jgi:hypothetical protein
MVDRPALLKCPSHFVLGLFQRFAQIVGGRVFFIERSMHLANRPFKCLAKLLANRSKFLAELLDQVSYLIFEPFGRVAILVVLVVLCFVLAHSREKWSIGTILVRGVHGRVGRRVVHSV